jgi:NAD(P)-dependent dehydrogenase (short-subunit alcohol dehydrogenase family)
MGQDAALSVVVARAYFAWMAQMPNEERKTLILTGASRGIGHATVKRFSSAGWRVITCSRHGFPEDCPWEAGPEDHIQVDLADPDNTMPSDRRDEGTAEGARRQAERAGQ